METVCKAIEDFVPDFCDQIKDLIPHDFIAKQKADYLKKLKENHPDNELIAILDFSENYAAVVQDEIQSHHFMRKQATVHPVCLYYKKNGVKEIQSIIVIAESLEHNIISVYMFIQSVVSMVKSNLPTLTK